MLALAFAAAAPHADEAPVDVQALSELPLERLLDVEIASASRFSQLASQAPSTVHVIRADDIRQFGWHTLGQALTTLPGLYLSNDRSYTYLGARGVLRPGDFNSRFLLLIDGIRVNDPLYGQATIGADSLVDLSLVERIEYVAGPGSAMYGSNAVLGVINVVTRPAADYPAPQVAAEIGSHGFAAARATAGWRIGALEATLSASALRDDGQDVRFPELDDGDEDGVAAGRDFEDADRLYARLAWQGGAVALAHSERRKGMANAWYWQVFDDPRSRLSDRYSLLMAKQRTPLGDAFELAASAYVGRYDYLGHYVYEGEAEGTRVVNHDEAQARWAGGEVSVTTDASARHRLAFGIDLRLDHHLAQTNFDVEPREVYLDDVRDARRIGLFVDDEIALRDDLQLNLGLRYDHDSASGANVSPRAALIWNAGGGASFKAMAGRAYREPNVYELYYAEAGGFEQRNNDDLQAERTHSAELAYLQRIGQRAELGVSVYRNALTDVITQVETESAEVAFLNLDSVRARGAEASFGYRWLGGAHARVAYAYADVEDSVGGRVPNAPRHVASATLHGPLVDRLHGGVVWRHVGARWSKGERVGAYDVFDLSLLWQASDALSLRLVAENVLDRAYADPVGPEFLQGRMPQDGRALRLELQYGF